MCGGSLATVKAPASCSSTTTPISSIDRGGLWYPRVAFVGFVIAPEGTAGTVIHTLLKTHPPLQEFSLAVTPPITKNPLLSYRDDMSDTHRKKLVVPIVKKFMRPFLANYVKNASEENQENKMLVGPAYNKL